MLKQKYRWGITETDSIRQKTKQIWSRESTFYKQDEKRLLHTPPKLPIPARRICFLRNRLTLFFIVTPSHMVSIHLIHSIFRRDGNWKWGRCQSPPLTKKRRVFAKLGAITWCLPVMTSPDLFLTPRHRVATGRHLVGTGTGTGKETAGDALPDGEDM